MELPCPVRDDAQSHHQPRHRPPGCITRRSRRGNRRPPAHGGSGNMLYMLSRKAREGGPRVTKAAEVEYLAEGGLPQYDGSGCNMGRVGGGGIGRRRGGWGQRATEGTTMEHRTLCAAMVGMGRHR